MVQRGMNVRGQHSKGFSQFVIVTWDTGSHPGSTVEKPGQVWTLLLSDSPARDRGLTDLGSGQGLRVKKLSGDPLLQPGFKPLS